MHFTWKGMALHNLAWMSDIRGIVYNCVNKKLQDRQAQSTVLGEANLWWRA